MKTTTVFVCQHCGAEYSKWQGQCLSCKGWNTLVEEVREISRSGRASSAGRPGKNPGKVVKLSEMNERVKDQERLKTGSGELDRVLGGGIVPGSVVLVAGEPGVGKSTLLTQLAMSIANGTEQIANSNTSGHKPLAISHAPVLYVCGEESVDQVALRVKRLDQSQKVKGKSQSNMGFLAETDVDTMIATVSSQKPAVMIVDSIQTLTTGDLTGMAGSVGQIRECTYRLIDMAKKTGIAVFIVGHVTKVGEIAGPKVLEHMVDAVLQLTGERTGMWRLLRAQKNRFGATDEVGVFQLTEEGMTDVANPSGAFLEESQAGVPGSVVVAVMEGTRPVLVEVQALVVESQLPVPRRVAHGVNINKLQLLSAVLQKRCRLALGTADVFVNVAGGLTLREPAADLGIALAIASSLTGKPVPAGTVVVGEVGLLGEVRRVSFPEKRIKEAKKLGYTRVMSPREFRSLNEVVKQLG